MLSKNMPFNIAIIFMLISSCKPKRGINIVGEEPTLSSFSAGKKRKENLKEKLKEKSKKQTENKFDDLQEYVANAILYSGIIKKQPIKNAKSFFKEKFKSKGQEEDEDKENEKLIETFFKTYLGAFYDFKSRTAAGQKKEIKKIRKKLRTLLGNIEDYIDKDKKNEKPNKTEIPVKALDIVILCDNLNKYDAEGFRAEFMSNDMKYKIAKETNEEGVEGEV